MIMRAQDYSSSWLMVIPLRLGAASGGGLGVGMSELARVGGSAGKVVDSSAACASAFACSSAFALASAARLRPAELADALAFLLAEFPKAASVRSRCTPALSVSTTAAG